jgi:hypothetical protein
MSVDQTVSEFNRLAKEDQTRLLLRLGVRLTTLSRAFVSGRKKRGVNEICHKIFGQLGHILSDTKQGYPDAVFVELLSEIASENHLAKEFSEALDFAFDVGETDESPGSNTTSRQGEKQRTKVASE